MAGSYRIHRASKLNHLTGGKAKPALEDSDASSSDDVELELELKTPSRRDVCPAATSSSGGGACYPPHLRPRDSVHPARSLLAKLGHILVQSRVEHQRSHETFRSMASETFCLEVLEFDCVNRELLPTVDAMLATVPPQAEPGTLAGQAVGALQLAWPQALQACQPSQPPCLPSAVLYLEFYQEPSRSAGQKRELIERWTLRYGHVQDDVGSNEGAGEPEGSQSHHGSGGKHQSNDRKGNLPDAHVKGTPAPASAPTPAHGSAGCGRQVGPIYSAGCGPDGVDGSDGGTRVAVSLRIALWLRAIYCTTRLLPAYARGRERVLSFAALLGGAVLVPFQGGGRANAARPATRAVSFGGVALPQGGRLYASVEYVLPDGEEAGEEDEGPFGQDDAKATPVMAAEAGLHEDADANSVGGMQGACHAVGDVSMPTGMEKGFFLASLGSPHENPVVMVPADASMPSPTHACLPSALHVGVDCPVPDGRFAAVSVVAVRADPAAASDLGAGSLASTLAAGNTTSEGACPAMVRGISTTTLGLRKPSAAGGNRNACSARSEGRACAMACTHTCTLPGRTPAHEGGDASLSVAVAAGRRHSSSSCPSSCSSAVPILRRSGSSNSGLGHAQSGVGQERIAAGGGGAPGDGSSACASSGGAFRGGFLPMSPYPMMGMAAAGAARAIMQAEAAAGSCRWMGGGYSGDVYRNSVSVSSGNTGNRNTTAINSSSSSTAAVHCKVSSDAITNDSNKDKSDNSNAASDEEQRTGDEMVGDMDGVVAGKGDACDVASTAHGTAAPPDAVDSAHPPFLNASLQGSLSPRDPATASGVSVVEGPAVPSHRRSQSDEKWPEGHRAAPTLCPFPVHRGHLGGTLDAFAAGLSRSSSGSSVPAGTNHAVGACVSASVGACAHAAPCSTGGAAMGGLRRTLSAVTISDSSNEGGSAATPASRAGANDGMGNACGAFHGAGEQGHARTPSSGLSAAGPGGGPIKAMGEQGHYLPSGGPYAMPHVRGPSLLSSTSASSTGFLTSDSPGVHAGGHVSSGAFAAFAVFGQAPGSAVNATTGPASTNPAPVTNRASQPMAIPAGATGGSSRGMSLPGPSPSSNALAADVADASNAAAACAAHAVSGAVLIAKGASPFRGVGPRAVPSASISANSGTSAAYGQGQGLFATSRLPPVPSPAVAAREPPGVGARGRAGMGSPWIAKGGAISSQSVSLAPGVVMAGAPMAGPLSPSSGMVASASGSAAHGAGHSPSGAGRGMGSLAAIGSLVDPEYMVTFLGGARSPPPSAHPDAATVSTGSPACVPFWPASHVPGPHHDHVHAPHLSGVLSSNGAASTTGSLCKHANVQGARYLHAGGHSMATHRPPSNTSSALLSASLHPPAPRRRLHRLARSSSSSSCEMDSQPAIHESARWAAGLSQVSGDSSSGRGRHGDGSECTRWAPGELGEGCSDRGGYVDLGLLFPGHKAHSGESDGPGGRGRYWCRDQEDAIARDGGAVCTQERCSCERGGGHCDHSDHSDHLRRQRAVSWSAASPSPRPWGALPRPGPQRPLVGGFEESLMVGGWATSRAGSRTITGFLATLAVTGGDICPKQRRLPFHACSVNSGTWPLMYWATIPLTAIEKRSADAGGGDPACGAAGSNSNGPCSPPSGNSCQNDGGDFPPGGGSPASFSYGSSLGRYSRSLDAGNGDPGWGPDGTSSPPGSSSWKDNLMRVPFAGQIQLVLSNPEGTPVHSFLCRYDLSDMGAGQKTFVRQRVLACPRAGSAPGRKEGPDGSSGRALRYALHVSFVCLGSSSSARRASGGGRSSSGRSRRSSQDIVGETSPDGDTWRSAGSKSPVPTPLRPQRSPGGGEGSTLSEDGDGADDSIDSINADAMEQDGRGSSAMLSSSVPVGGAQAGGGARAGGKKRLYISSGLRVVFPQQRTDEHDENYVVSYCYPENPRYFDCAHPGAL